MFETLNKVLKNVVKHKCVDAETRLSDVENSVAIPRFLTLLIFFNNIATNESQKFRNKSFDIISSYKLHLTYKNFAVKCIFMYEIEYYK